MGSGETRDEVTQRIPHRLKERVRYPLWQRRPERISEPGRVLGRRPPLLAGYAQGQDTPGLLEFDQPGLGSIRVDATRALTSSRWRSPSIRRRVVKRVGIPDLLRFGQQLQLELQLGKGRGIDELPELRLAHQLGEHRPIQRQGLRAPLG